MGASKQVVADSFKRVHQNRPKLKAERANGTCDGWPVLSAPRTNNAAFGCLSMEGLAY